MSKLKSFKIGLNLDPRSSDPTSPAEGDLYFSDGTARAKGLWQYKDSAWTEIGSGGGGLDVFLTESFESTDSSDVLSGQDATFDNGGSLGGALADEESSQAAGLRSLKYTTNATPGSSTNDFFYIPAITVEEKQKGNDVGLTFYYKWDGSADLVRAVVYDDTNNVVLSTALDMLEPTSTFKRFSTSVLVPTNCTSLKVGFHHTGASESSKELIVDDIELSTDPFVYKKIVDPNDVGSIHAFGTTTTPSGFLYCDGSAVSRVVYSELFDSIGTAYGEGDGSTTFNLPDLRGQFLRGQDDGTGTDPDSGSRTANNAGGNTGDNVGSEQTDAIQGHKHGSVQFAGGAGSGFFLTTQAATSVTTNDSLPTGNPITDGTNGTPRTSSETRPTNVNVRYYIRYTSASVSEHVVTPATSNDIGEIAAYGTTTTPDGFLYCDGSAVSRTAYAALFEKVGTAYGEGDGSTTFNVPDLRGQFLRGQDDGTGTDPDAGSRTAQNSGGNTGDNVGSEQGFALQDHEHDIAPTIYPETNIGGVSPAATGTGTPRTDDWVGAAETTGGGGTLQKSTETRPTNVNVRYYIRYKGAPKLAFIPTMPVGTVLQSMLDETTMNANNTGLWVLMDGRDVTNTDYASLTGDTTVPDSRGRFLRMKDHGAGVNPDGDVSLGTNQTDAIQGHYHATSTAGVNIGGGSGIVQNYAGATGAQHVQGPISDGVNGTPRTASETRAVNTTVNFFIRVN
jgi:microcystin-dependent protein